MNSDTQILHEQKSLDVQQSSPVLVVRDLYKSFGENHVLKGFNLKLFKGENLVVLGKSGSGKSVLIKCIVRLLDYDTGELEVLEKEISDLDQEELDLLRTDIGFLFQSGALYDSMTVRENLEFPMRRHPQKLAGVEDPEEWIRETLRSVGLEEAIDLMPEELSGGMKKRIALARTLILRPKIILYDEPTSGLDPVTAKEISNLILEVREKYGAASLIITHDMECARVASDRMILLINGKNYAEGTFYELKKSNDIEVKSFFDLV